MIRRFFILICFVCFTTCDDGDIINVRLDFDKELDRCDNFENSYLLYDTREDPNEALILTLPKPEYDYLFNALPDNEPVTLTIGASTGIRFNYRTYSNVLSDGILCNELSDPSLVVINNYETDGGDLRVTVNVIDDDNDGIPSADEDLNGNGNYDDDDFDNDGIPNYLDEDDDNDNVKTEDEIEGGTDNNPITSPLDTDGDGNPDYLDEDDDDDGILTRLEDQNSDKNPRGIQDEVMDENGIGIYRYLYNHPTAMEEFDDSGFINNTYTKTTTSRFELENIGLQIIDATYIDLGSFVSPIEEITQIND